MHKRQSSKEKQRKTSASYYECLILLSPKMSVCALGERWISRKQDTDETFRTREKAILFFVQHSRHREWALSAIVHPRLQFWLLLTGISRMLESFIYGFCAVLFRVMVPLKRETFSGEHLSIIIQLFSNLQIYD